MNQKSGIACDNCKYLRRIRSTKYPYICCIRGEDHVVLLDGPYQWIDDNGQTCQGEFLANVFNKFGIKEEETFLPN